MTYLKKIVLLFLFTTILVSCKEDKKPDPAAAMMKEVLAVHDEVMDEMPVISKLVKTLKPKVDSTKLGRDYELAMKNLQKSNTEMMDWMQNFSKRFDSDEITNGKELSPEKKQWLTEEKQKIEALKQNFEVHISEAEHLLNTQ